MSSYDDLLKELKKRGLTIEDAMGKPSYRNTNKNNISVPKELVDELKKRGLTVEDAMHQEDIATVVRPSSTNKGNGIAKDGNDSLLDFFQKGAFEDGYQFGDVTKSILGTAGDAGLNLFKGVAGLGEGIFDLAGYGVAGVADLFGKDEWADNLRDRLKVNAIEEQTEGAQEFLDKYSVLGRTSDAVMQGIGQMGAIMATGGVAGASVLGSTGATILTTGTMGLSGMGSGMSEAYQNNATDEEALTYGLIAGAADVFSELIFGGMGKMVNAKGLSSGITSLDDIIAKKVSNLFSNQIAKNFAEFGIKASAEGLEEVLAGTAQAWGKWQTYHSEEEFLDILKDENLLEQFVVGMATSGMMQSGIIPGTQSGSLREANATGRDFITGFTQNEQAVIKKETEKRIEAEEAGGKKLTNKEKADIEARVEKEMEKGYISTDTIEEALGDRSRYDAIRKEAEEFDTLFNTASGQLSKAQQNRLAELEAKNKENPYKKLVEAEKGKFTQSVRDMVKGDRLIESYLEQERAYQDFVPDYDKFKGTKHADAARKTIESAIAMGANNTNRVRDQVEFAAQVAGDTGRVIIFKDGDTIKADFIARQTKEIAELEKIHEAQRTAEQSKKLEKMKELLQKVESGETTVHGDISSNGELVLNLDSPKPLNRTVGHEVTHHIEVAKAYDKLRDYLFEYAKTKGVDIDSAIAEAAAQYAGVTNANAEAEVVADLVGDYLFSDAEFVNRLAVSDKNVFQRMWDSVKHLAKLATAGSKEARQLEQLQYTFEKAYQQANRGQTKTAQDGGVNLSIETTPDGRKYVQADRQVIFGNDPDSWSVQVEDYINGKIRNGENVSFVAEDGEVLVLTADTAGKIASNKTSHGTTMDDDKFYTKANAGVHIDELAQVSVNADPNKAPKTDVGSRHGAFAEGGWTYRTAFFRDFDGKYYRLTISAARGTDGNVVYNIGNIEERSFPKVVGSSAKGGALNGETSSNEIVQQKEENVNKQYSLSSIANSFFGDENMTAEQFRKADYRQTQGYKDYVEQSLENYRQSRKDFDEAAARQEIEQAVDGIIRVAIAAKEAGYDIQDTDVRRNARDSKKRLLFSSLEPNSEYLTSHDISTICDKRKNFADIYDDIVRMEEKKGVPQNKRFFSNVDNYFYLHKLMADKGLTQPCRQCYVESMRKNLAPMANAFLRLVGETNPDNTANDQLYQQSGKNKGNLKVNNASTRELVLATLDAYDMKVSDLTVEMLTTEDGLAQLKLQAPLVYEAFNSFYGQSKPKMPKSATPFRFGELTALLTDEKGKIKKSLVDKINSTGGFRLQSYSDFQIQNFTDVLQVLFEAGTLGLNGHAYTKVPAFLEATEGTNLKRNISIFMYKDGNEWKLDRNDSFPYSLDEIYEIVKADKTGNTGIIAVSQNADMSAWIMANDLVGFGIPFHKSGLKMGTVRDTIVRENGREIKGYSGTKDHTKQQTEVWARSSDDHKALTKVNKGINIYSFWDFDNKGNLSKNELIEKNVKAYIDACELAGYLPKFREYVMNNGKVLSDVLAYSKELGYSAQDATVEDISFEYKGYRIPYGYYKFLGDFGMFTPDGQASAQETLSLKNYDFDKAVNTFKDAEALRRNEILQQFSNGEERARYRDSDLTAEQLADIVKQKRREVAESVVDGYSLSDGSKEYAPGSFDFYGRDFRVKEGQAAVEDIAPVAESAAVEETVSKTESVADMFPDDTAPIQKEYEFLLAEREDIRGAMDAFAAIGNYTEAERLMADYEDVQTKIAEIEADEADRLASIEDTDAPPELAENNPEDVADNVPLTTTLVTELAKTVRAQLGLPAKRVAEVRDLITRYSNEEFPSKAHLYTEIAEKFGTYTETQVDEDLKGVKSLLRTYGIRVDDSIKHDIADYGQLMRSNFGKVRFSKEGLPVDVAYREFQEALPGYFPESIDVPTDQLMRIIEVANMDTTIEQTQEIDWQTLEDVTDTIMNTVGEFKQSRKESLANAHGRESFQSLMEDADRYVPPIAPWNRPPTRAEINASPDDIAPTFDTGSGQQAFIPEDVAEEAPKKVTRKVLHENIVDNIKTTFREKGFEFDDVLKNAKDLSTFATVDNTPQRVMEKALGYKEGQALGDLTVNKVAQNETEGIRWLNSFTDKKTGLIAKISKQYNIKPGSKASKAAQMYAEGFYVGENDAIIEYGDRELAMDFPDAKVQENIKKLAKDPRIRQIYDETLAAINESRTRNAYPEIPRLDNYFLHFRAMEDTFSRLGLPFNPNDIRAKDLPTDLNGVTADLKPGQPYFASAKHREGKRTSFDLLGGLEKYLTSAKNQIYHIDDIQTLRALRNYVAGTYGQATGLEDLDLLSNEEAEQRIEQVYNSHLSTFAKFLNEEANVLAGKTSLIDRGLEGVIGRRGITFLDTLNRQVGANMVGFNVSSALTNFLAPVQAFAKSNKFDFVKAMAQTASNKIGSIFGNGDSFADESPVMIRRKGAERFYRTPYEKVADTGYVLMSAVDNLSTELIARTKYNELTRKGMDSQQAHIETDKWVSRLMGDRSIGQQPQLYNSKMLGIITKFQLEVRNQLDSQFYDTIQEAKVSTEQIENKLQRNAKKAAKIASTFVQLAVMQHLFGKAFESVAGYNPAFDIIEALVKAFGWDDEEDEEDTVLDNLEEGFLSLLGDLPYTSTLTGGRIPIESALPITELIKGKDQYGNEKSRWDTIKEAAPYYLLPGGYGQIKKTKQGLAMFDEDLPIAGSYTDSGNLRFPVEDTLKNRVQAGLFGQWASANARDYFDNERKPLKEKQIQELIDVDLPIREYWDYREELSKYDTVKDKIQFIESLDLPISKKNILVNNAADRKTPIDLTNYDQYSGYEEFDFASKNPEKYSFLKENNVSYTDYTRNEDTKEFYDGVYSWASTYPEKVTVSKAVTNSVVEYRQYATALDSIRADKDSSGKTISGSAKAKKVAYINGLNIDYGAKLILFKSEYNADDTYNYEIVEYLNGRDDISYDEMNTILRELGFNVTPDGYITW